MVVLNRKITQLCLSITAMIMCAGMAVDAVADLTAAEIFATPEQAVDALITANRNDSKAEILKILGPQAEQIVSSGDDAADKENRDKFLAAYDLKHQLESEGDDKEVLLLGANAWPLPIPLVRKNNAWQFDTLSGVQEILDRRIGHNELNVIEICRAYVEAQEEYADQHMNKNGTREYAQRFVSEGGLHNGLYWPTAPGEPESPLGPLIALAQASDASNEAAEHYHVEPYHGYYYKILTGQSKNANGGAINYISNDKMIGGFALLAFPAKYGDSGIMTFMVDKDGIVLQKDLGQDTVHVAPAITQYDPDAGWNIIKD